MLRTTHTGNTGLDLFRIMKETCRAIYQQLKPTICGFPKIGIRQCDAMEMQQQIFLTNIVPTSTCW
jgi:hypothetical protein